MTQESSADSEQKIDKQPSKKPYVLFVLIILVIVGALFAGYAYIRQLTWQVDQQFSTVTREFTALSNNLQEQQAKLITDQTQAVFGSEQRLAWENYLGLQQANTALHINYDYAFALQILKTLREKDSTNPKFQTLVESLNKDIQTLEAIKPVDQNFVYDQIEKISQHISTLAMIAKPIVPASDQPNNEVPIKSSTWTDWRKFPEQIRSYIKRVVILQRTDATEQPANYINDPQQTRYLILLKLNQAQFALLQKQQVIFVESLGAASNLIVQMFYMNHSAVAADLKNLQDLTKTIIAPPVPDLSASLKLAESMIGSMNEEHKK